MLRVRGEQIAILAFAILIALTLPLALPNPARADCAVGDVGCVEVDRTAGTPGTLVRFAKFGAGCDLARDIRIAFVTGAYDRAASYPTTPVERRTEGGTLVLTFRVPIVPPGVYQLSLSCDSDIVFADDNPGSYLGFTFTVLEVPATDTVATTPLPGPSIVAVLAGVGAFLLTLCRSRRGRQEA